MDNFNFKRFSQVVAYDARNLWPRFGLTMLIVTVVPIAFWMLRLVLNSNITSEPLCRFIYIACAIALVAILAPSRLYKTCNQSKRGIHFAMLPASTLEKFWSMVLYTLIVCPLLCLAGSIVVDLIIYLIPYSGYNELIPFKECLNSIFAGREEYLWLSVATLLTSIVGSCAIYFFTNTIFQRHKVISTILWLMLIQFAISMVLIPIVLAINWENVANFTYTWDIETSTTRILTISMVINSLFTIGLYYWSYRRLQKMRY